MNANLKAASDCFIDKSLLKCLAVNHNVTNVLSYDIIDLCHALNCCNNFHHFSFFGLTVSPAQQRYKMFNEFAGMK